MQASSDTKGPAQRAAAPAPPPDAAAESITLYHWLVVFFASCGWLFDCMGQRIFVLSREPAMRELLGATASDHKVLCLGDIWPRLLMMVGWATGGILFGMMSDHYGRVKAMVSTLLAYTLFSGLSGFAHTGVEFLVFRFLFGLGVGGMFGAATTLVAESVPRRFRTTGARLDAGPVRVRQHAGLRAEPQNHPRAWRTSGAITAAGRCCPS